MTKIKITEGQLKNLQEIFNNVQDYWVAYESKSETHVKFKAGGDEFTVHLNFSVGLFMDEDLLRNIIGWDLNNYGRDTRMYVFAKLGMRTMKVDFFRGSQAKKPDDKEDSSEVANQVFSTVSAIVQEYFEKNDILAIGFVGESEKKQSIYKKMVKRMSNLSLYEKYTSAVAVDIEKLNKAVDAIKSDLSINNNNEGDNPS